MADAVAIISVVSGATVAIAVPFINARLERRRLRWETQERRMDDARNVLDRATAAFSSTLWELHFTWRALAPPGSLPKSFKAPMPTGFEPAAGLRRADEHRREAMLAGDALALRFGREHSVVMTYDNGVTQLGQLTAALLRAEAGSAPDGWWQSVRRELDAAWKSRNAIADEASLLVGVAPS